MTIIQAYFNTLELPDVAMARAGVRTVVAVLKCLCEAPHPLPARRLFILSDDSQQHCYTKAAQANFCTSNISVSDDFYSVALLLAPNNLLIGRSRTVSVSV